MWSGIKGKFVWQISSFFLFSFFFSYFLGLGIGSLPIKAQTQVLIEIYLLSSQDNKIIGSNYYL